MDSPASINWHRSVRVSSSANISSVKGMSSSVDVYHRSEGRSGATDLEPGRRVRFERRTIAYDYAGTVRVPGEGVLAVALAYEAVREETEASLPTWASWTVAYFCRDPAETRPTTVGDLLVLGDTAYEVVADGFEERSGLSAPGPGDGPAR